MATAALSITVQEFLRLSGGAHEHWFPLLFNETLPLARAGGFVVTVTPMQLIIAAAGLGIGLLPEFLCRQGLATGRLKPVLPEWSLPPADARFALYPASLESDARVQQFVDFLAANIVPALAATPAART